jgi:16S rRNA (guanine966-N2)-methyltransferase
MRVVAGTSKGLRLAAPEGTTTRPTSDRVREAVFNALGSLGVIDDALVVDLFCGSGAMGIEALSRGAAQAVFVDRDPRAIATTTANLRRCGLEGRAQVVRGTVAGWLSTAPQVDLVLADPPYEFADWDCFAPLDSAWVVAESDREVSIGDRVPTRVRRYGRTWVAIFPPVAR